MSHPRQTVTGWIGAVAGRIADWRDAQLADPRHSERVAAILGITLAVSFTICFATGIISHLVQHPTSWFSWPSRPAGLYRFTQGLHVVSGIAAVPLLLVKLGSVFPQLFQWPIADGFVHLLERLSLLPLVGGALFMLVTGVANIELWYPWVFFFPAGHYAVSWVVMGALVIHVAAKASISRNALRRPIAEPATTRRDRRRFLLATAGASGTLVAVTIGQTYRPLRKIALLAPRRPDIGVQGFPVNKTVREAGVGPAIADPAFALTVRTAAFTKVLGLGELASLPQRTATLPIACVEGWSASLTWTGVSIATVLEHVGIADATEVRVGSVQKGGRYRSSVLTGSHVHDRDTLLATHVGGEPLHPDHGYPLRLIAPNRPGVLQTKWVGTLDIR